MRAVEQIQPRPGWALCRTLEPARQTRGGLAFARDLETGKTTETVARVLRVSPARSKSGERVDPGFASGDLILIRDFLKFANPVGDMVGADRDDRVFLLNNKDALAVVGGSGILGFYGEFEIDE